MGAAAATTGCSAAAAAALGGRGGAAVLSRLEGGAVGRVGVPGTDDTTPPAPPQGSIRLRCGKQGDLAGTGEPLLLDPSGDGRSMLGDGHGDEE